MPHSGTHVPPELAARMTESGRAVPDTDWLVDELYDFATEVGASLLVASHSRFVIDLNRPPDGGNLYPGQDTPELVPLRTFANEPIWLPGEEPCADEVEARRERFWQPYHDQLARTLDVLRTAHGTALLWDAHSIAREVPRLFEGALPDLNLGTAGGASCGAELREELTSTLQSDAARAFSCVVDGRFRGGYITRHYGAPARNVHAVQMELAQDTYMVAGGLDADRAGRLRPTLRSLIEAFTQRSGGTPLS